MKKNINNIDYGLGQKVFNIANITFMCFLIVVTFYPLYYVIMSSFSEPHLFMSFKGILLKPLGFTLESYKYVLSYHMIISGYKNTIFIVVVGVAVNIILTSLGAYFLSRKDVMWRKPIMFGIVFTMFFNGGMIPFFITVKDLHLNNTIWSLIFPVAINTFNLIIMRTAFMAIPESLEESAKIDGAGHITILVRVVFPLALPTVAVMVLYYGVAHWNSWFHALLFVNTKRDLYPLQLALREILIVNDTSAMTSGSGSDQQLLGETIKHTVIVVATVPILALYPFLQRYFVKGVMVGAIKG